MTVRITMNIPETLACIQAAVCGLTLVNLAILQTTKCPPLYSSGARYVRESARKEIWQPITDVIRRKMGDCEDLAAARCAELRHSGEAAGIVVKLVQPGLIHIMVRRGDGTLEDPSKILGMRGAG